MLVLSSLVLLNLQAIAFDGISVSTYQPTHLISGGTFLASDASDQNLKTCGPNLNCKSTYIYQLEKDIEAYYLTDHLSPLLLDLFKRNGVSKPEYQEVVDDLYLWIQSAVKVEP